MARNYAAARPPASGDLQQDYKQAAKEMADSSGDNG